MFSKMFIPSVKGFCTALILSHNIFSQEVVHPPFTIDQRKDKFIDLSLIIGLHEEEDISSYKAISLDFLFAINDYWQLGSTSQVVWVERRYWFWEEFINRENFFETGVKSKVILNLIGPLAIHAGGSIFTETFVHIFVGTQVRLRYDSPIMFEGELDFFDFDSRPINSWSAHLKGGIVYSFH